MYDVSMLTHLPQDEVQWGAVSNMTAQKVGEFLY
jgi:hypothetical protein